MTKTTSRVRAYGLAGARAMDAKEKRMDRMKRDLRHGGDVGCGGIRHPFNCLCYDCLFGEVAEARLLVDNPRPFSHTPPQSESWQYAKRGRVALSSGGHRLSV